MIQSTLRSAFISVVTSTAIGCAGPRVATEGAIEPQSYDQRAGCVPAPFPTVLPAVAQVLDSPSLLIEMAGHRATSDESVLGIRFDASGAPAPASVLESPLPPAVADSLAAVITAHIRTQTSAPLWGVRVRVRHGAPQGLTIERSMFCPPRATQGAMRIPFEFRGTPAEMEEFRRARPPRLLVLVSASGSVTEVRILQSSGISAMDRSYTDGARSLRFEPARLDGAAVPAWFEIGVP